MRVGIVPDLHNPFTHPMGLAFCQDIFERNRVDRVVFIGDIFDNHAVSFHEHDPDGMSAGHELEAGRRLVRPWYKAFSDADVCIGNHDALPWRQARANGLPSAFLRESNEIWNTPKWRWNFSFEIDDVGYTHGTGNSGKNAALNLAIQSRRSTVIGHVHSWAGVQWHTNPRDRIFGMNVACLIDCRAYAFAYGRDFVVRPSLGCGVVIDGVGHWYPMACGRGEKYNRSRAKKKRK